jgi:hypothetical protein
MTPDHAYRLLQALQENVQRYEDSFGTINKDGADAGFQFPMSYNGPIGEA